MKYCDEQTKLRHPSYDILLLTSESLETTIQRVVSYFKAVIKLEILAGKTSSLRRVAIH